MLTLTKNYDNFARVSTRSGTARFFCNCARFSQSHLVEKQWFPKYFTFSLDFFYPTTYIYFAWEILWRNILHQIFQGVHKIWLTDSIKIQHCRVITQCEMSVKTLVGHKTWTHCIVCSVSNIASILSYDELFNLIIIFKYEILLSEFNANQ